MSDCMDMDGLLVEKGDIVLDIRQNVDFKVCEISKGSTGAYASGTDWLIDAKREWHASVQCRIVSKREPQAKPEAEELEPDPSTWEIMSWKPSKTSGPPSPPA